MVRVFKTKRDYIIETGGTQCQTSRLSLDDLFRQDDPESWLLEALPTWNAEPVPPPDLSQPWDAPVQSQEIWAAGVTYFRSRTERMREAESTGGDIFYDRVYEAERPELFFKATAPRARGHRAPIRIRSDSTWDVPEPELTLAINAAGRVFGYTIGNDVSSRSIEGENPLYLPQAKVYAGSCAIGPCLVLGPPPSPDAFILLEILRSGETVFSGDTKISQLKRSFEELAGFLFRDNEFPDGALLMTGTGIVPGEDFTLKSGDEVRIAIDGAGTLINSVA